MTKADTLALTPGTRVFCTVHAPYPSNGYLGWRTLVAVRPRDGYIKVAGVSGWCPPYNFTLEDPRS